MASSAIYGKISEERLSGTADWIIERDEVQKWLQGEIPVLVVHGEPGIGKTFLSVRRRCTTPIHPDPRVPYDCINEKPLQGTLLPLIDLRNAY